MRMGYGMYEGLSKVLKGVKRGIMELSDLLVVTKDDGDLKAKARVREYTYSFSICKT